VARKFFADSNIFIYLLTDDDEKARKAEVLLETGPTISVQVLNEIVAVARRKYKLDWSVVETILMPIRAVCEIVPITEDTHVRAVAMAKVAKIGIYDANIIAAAELAGCDVLYTEDLSHGQRIGSVVICNPFI
jgi:predicted nucleic acid-binding protein